MEHSTEGRAGALVTAQCKAGRIVYYSKRHCNTFYSSTSKYKIPF